jgi:hypothetical protein
MQQPKIVSINDKSVIDFNSENMTVRYEDLDPEKAKEYLKRNHPNNRRLSKDRVLRYSMDMAKDMWYPTGDPIRFDIKGFLVDGQHRLAACIRSGKTLKNVPVVTNLSEDAMRVIDQGQKRTASQIVKISGNGISNEELSIARVLFWTVDSTNNGDLASVELVRDMYYKHQEAVRFAVALYDSKTKSISYAPIRGVIALAYYYIDLEVLASFMFTLDTGVLKDHRVQSAFLLRNEFLTSRKKTNTRDARALFYKKTISALKYVVEGRRDVKQLRASNDQCFVLPAK